MNEEQILDFSQYNHNVDKKEILFAYVKNNKLIETALERFCLFFAVRNKGLKGIENHIENKFHFLTETKQESEELKRKIISFFNKKGIKNVKLDIFYNSTFEVKKLDSRINCLIFGKNEVDEKVLGKAFEIMKVGGHLFFKTDAKILYLPEFKKTRELMLKSRKLYQIRKEEEEFSFLLSESKRDSLVLIIEGNITKQTDFKEIYHHDKFYI